VGGDGAAGAAAAREAPRARGGEGGVVHRAAAGQLARHRCGVALGLGGARGDGVRRLAR
jgi:hypothetical protein